MAAHFRLGYPERLLITEHNVQANQLLTHPNAMDEAARRRYGMGLAGLGVLALSFDALLVRLAAASPADVSFWRGSLIFCAMAVLQLVYGGRLRRPGSRREAIALAAVVLLYGANTGAFVLSVTYTRVANTVVILSCAPFFAAILSWLFLRERVRLRTWVAIAMSVFGVVVVFAGSMGQGTWIGDGFAVLVAVQMGAALTILRRLPEVGRIPVTAGAGLVAGVLAWPWAEPLALSAPSYGWLAIMGLVQMPLAMVLIMTATRYMSSPEVSLFLLIEAVLGPIWVWLVLSEEPPPLTVVGGAAILGAVAVHSWLTLREAKRQAAERLSVGGYAKGQGAPPPGAR